MCNKVRAVPGVPITMEFFSDLHYYSTFLDDDDPDTEDMFLASCEGQLPIYIESVAPREGQLPI